MIHDPKLLQRLDSRNTLAFAGTVFRATRVGQDPLAPSSRGGRWMVPDHVPVLYTSMERDGAIAEVAFHLSQLTPRPSKPIEVHEIEASARKTLRLVEADLFLLGVDPSAYKAINYPRTQEIGAAVEFLGCDGLIVPSLRWKCENAVFFVDRHDLAADTLRLVSTETIGDWQGWAREHGLLDDTAPA